MNNLARWPGAEDLCKLVQFIEHDRDERAAGRQSFFKEEVFEPPCISVNVTDKRFAAAVESLLNKAQLQVCLARSLPAPRCCRLTASSRAKTVICTCQEDQDKLTSFFSGSNNPLGQQLKRINITQVPGEYVPQRTGRTRFPLPLTYQQVRNAPDGR